MLKSLFISYILFLLIPLVIGGMGSFFLNETIKKEALNTNSLLLDQINKTVDLGLKSIYQGIFQTSQDDIIKSFFLEDQELDENSRYKITQINSRITEIISSHQLISGMFVYYLLKLRTCIMRPFSADFSSYPVGCR